MHFFSICLPTYKALFLKECLDSILQQTYLHFELIILNDHSPEPVIDIINLYKDERIRYYCNDKNVGAEKLVDNWNHCLNLAKGDFIVMMGDDDKMDPNYLEEFAEFIDKYPDLDVYHCRSKIINENSEFYSITPLVPEFETIYDYLWAYVKFDRQQYIGDFVYRTSAMKTKGGFYNLPLGWTSDFLTALIYCSDKGIAYTKSPVLNFRLSQYSISSSGDILLKRKAELKYIDWIESFLNKDALNDQDKIIRSEIRNTMVIFKEHMTLGFLSMLMGGNKFISGSFILLKSGGEYKITFKNYIKAVITSFVKHTVKLNY